MEGGNSASKVSQVEHTSSVLGNTVDELEAMISTLDSYLAPVLRPDEQIEKEPKPTVREQLVERAEVLSCVNSRIKLCIDRLRSIHDRLEH